MADTITISSLSVHLASGAGPSAFGLIPPPPCPVELTLQLSLHPSVVPHCVDEDDMAGLGVNYSSVSKAVYALASGGTFSSPQALLHAAAGVPLALPAVRSVTLAARLPRALLHADAATYTATYTNPSPTPRATTPDAAQHAAPTLKIENLRVATIIGLHPHERAERQRLEVDIDAEGNHKAIADSALGYLEASSFGTLESLADTFARHLLSLGLDNVGVTIRKPSALPFATPSIGVTRSRGSYAARGGVSPAAVAAAGARAFSTAVGGPPKAPATETAESRRVFIAVGSNIGDWIGHIRRAIALLAEGGCRLVATSRLYESEPMYVTAQDVFTNGVVEVRTSLSPLELLRLLKRTEAAVGRVKTYANGPRVIDLDLVLYGAERVAIGEPGAEPDTDGVGWLTVPHASLAEREFVLRPLADIDPSITPPGLGESVASLLAKVPAGGLAPIIPFPAPARPLRLTSPSTPAIMAIFNATPDSFSDGAADRTRAPAALDLVQRTMAAAPAILDIGGMSTRPNSQPCSEEEETARVVPLVRAIRESNSPDLAAIPISVDTYRPAVAAAAVAAGASCINDVRGGREDGMLAAMAAADVPVILMHSRGDSVSMLAPEQHAYPAGVVAGVAEELLAAADAALAAGVKRWNIVLDPGLGFAKNHAQNLVLLRDLRALADRLRGWPLLVGGSRKGFVGRASGIEVAAQRGPADAAVNTLCAMSGVVDILRVHAPAEADASVRMAAAIRDVEE